MSIKARPVKGTVRLNNNYNNVIKFNSNAEKFEYLESVEEGFTYYLGQSPDINFNIGDTINTDITLDYSKYGDDLNSALNRNYLVVADSNFALGYYFYFIVGATPLNRGLVRYDLELDVFTTYTINKDYEIDDFLVERAHQDRFTEDSSAALATFNLSNTAPAQAPDNAEYTFQGKYPAQRAEIEYGRALCDSDATYEKFKQIQGWLVVYGTSERLEHDEYPVLVKNAASPYDAGNLKLPYYMYVAPFAPESVYGYVKDPVSSTARYGSLIWSAENLYETLQAGTKSFATASIMISKTCPVEYQEGDSPVFSLRESDGALQFSHVAYLENQSIKIRKRQLAVSGDFSSFTSPTKLMFYFNNIVLDKQLKKSDDITLEELGLTTSFNDLNKSDLREATKEPKMLKKTATDISIDNYNMQDYASDAFELDETFNILSVESISPSSVGHFTTFYAEGSYSECFYEHNVGAVSRDIIDLPVVSDAWTEYVQANKNHLATGLIVPTIQTYLNGSFDASAAFANGNPAAGFATAGKTLVNTAAGATNYFLERNNIKKTPDSVRAFSSDFLYGMYREKGFHDYLVVNTLKDKERAMACEYYYKYGYAVQERRNSTELFGRYIFNYVQAMDSTADKMITNVPMSNMIKNVIETTIQKGVTFWNYDSGKMFDYSYENYESRLFDTEVNND